MTKAIGYIRVSTEMQANEGVSLEAQSAKIRAYCELNDLELVEIVCDAGKSAKTTNREGLQKCLAMIAAGEVAALVVYKLDRLSRKVLDTLNLISEIESHGASLHSISEKLDTSSALGKFFVNMTAALAQLERDQISERVTMAMAHKKNEGQHCGSPAYGFTMVEKKLVKVAKEHEAIALIQQMKADGANLQAIADELNNQGITTKRGAKWQPMQVSRVLNRG
ncbi:recombinase family protein [Pseudanabaena sp. FACHB-1277]|uniref:Recombinase family protein n=1 Tax=Pseudanabaena cinerea FACHB-1277 TaxID=2949581 RepID=A0A926Z7Y7_9CYAN|nr:recombinase family protein [Pseudanabaena cinerea]MBD2152616.1 recombinase family protein [Pseudanabaena cinerea FACHB-1277]